jgi:2'-5' RNA ligase superfamily
MRRLHAGRISRTALIVAVPEAEAIVREIRLRYVSSASQGVGAHITVLSPFADSDDIDEQALAELFKSHSAFDFVLDRIERWDDGIVWLHPEPSRPFEDLTTAVWQRWPNHPPYEGTIEAVIPHLTLSETPIEVDIDLPIRSRATEVALIEEDANGMWAKRDAFPLA